MTAATFCLLTVGCYLAAGIVFAAVFIPLGLRRIDPAARGAGALFRLVIFPGLTALWPVMLIKWLGR